MNFVGFWHESWTAALVNHLWQSTAVVVIAWALAVALKKNHARVRYWVWFAASIKFLLPFSMLIAAGEWLRSLIPVPAEQPAVASVMEQVTQPFGQKQFFDAGNASIAAHHASIWPLVLFAVWLCGASVLAIRFGLAWAKVNSVKRKARPLRLVADVPVLSSSAPIEPGIFGVFQPVLLLPDGILERLSAEQMRAIVAHEMCHVRRRDNLTFAIHMVVETLLWFHPAVWWIGSHLIEEREHACDQVVMQMGGEAQVYAEGILNVCKFYVESPLNCVSGVTGSELKQRIVRILSGQSVRKLDLRRKVLLALACMLAVVVPVTVGLAHAAQKQTLSAGAPKNGGIAGSWQGTMQRLGRRNERVVLRITKDEKGVLSATLNILGQDGPPMVASSVSFESGALRFVNDFPGLTYEGKMSADGNSISGTMTQNGSFPLVLERATPETAWATPAPRPRIPPMAADAHPTFEVATIKPASPDTRQSMFRVRGADLVVENLTFDDLIKFAYDVQSRQIAGGPGWLGTSKWDIEAKPDRPGMPSQSQLKEMLQKLLADRFALKVHAVKREMAAYALLVSKDGPKLTKSAGTSNLGGFTMGPLGVMHAGSATMGDFAQVLQSGILDRPVVDQTGLIGKWDFTLKWAPDETQFAGMGVTVPPESDAANALPPLFTAIQEQLGLKLEARKAEVPVLVIDHVEQPSPN